MTSSPASTPTDTEVEPVPAGARLLHIGLPKTGSTALQHAASRLKKRLREEGVIYPGKGENHHKGTSWLAGLKVGYLPDPTPQELWWLNLKRELDRHESRRGLISFEMICTTNLDGAHRTVDALGDGGRIPVHVTLVLRNFGTFVPSYWQESLKRGNTESLDTYLRRVLKDPATVEASGAFHRRDGYGLLERWSAAVGPENITVIVLDKARPTRLFDTFESMLGLPDGMLRSEPPVGAGANRGMSAAEAALVHRLNEQIVGEWRAAPPEHRNLVHNGVVNRLLSSREPAESEGRLRIPGWAAQSCVEAGRILADSVRSTGVRVVGDLAELERPVPTADDESLAAPDVVPFDFAVEALLGMFARATGWNADHTKPLAQPDTHQSRQ
ncbi:hypothetical protein C8K30_101890 [Promicromonospora sp. AC04]|uniref:hypothetical protein n=1 Tax=Promicromonospora sp. AC04 TaxID=2135723 RepID=UPI000D3CA267|nr:hypothetical protein [Promicromonospora sp. AC04]PUB32364.1 hypothetical protein C8K30_101890 [Promicromonospora sp. AC04]